MADPQTTAFTSSLREDRVFPPPPEFAARAHIRSRAEYDAMYRRSIDDNEVFWAEQARELDWFTEPEKTLLEWNVCRRQKWFVGGKLNLCYNAVDRHALGHAQQQDRAAVGGRTR